MAGWSVLSHTKVAGAASSAAVTTPAINTTGADVIVFATTEATANALGAPSDSASNTWPAATINDNDVPDTRRAVLYVLRNPTTSASHTFTWTPGGTNSAFSPVVVIALSGSLKSATPVDQTSSANSGVTLVTTEAAGSITPTQNNEMLVTVLAHSFTPISAASINNGTIYESLVYVGGTTYGLYLGAFNQVTAAAINETWSWTTAVPATAMVVSLKAAPALVPGRRLVRPYSLVVPRRY
jgi:hypothetical protein